MVSSRVCQVYDIAFVLLLLSQGGAQPVRASVVTLYA
jgi:hypothetical protein